MEDLINLEQGPLGIEYLTAFEEAEDKRQWLLDHIPGADFPKEAEIIDILIAGYEAVLETVQMWADTNKAGRKVGDLVPDWTLYMLLACYCAFGKPMRAFDATILSVLPGWDGYNEREGLIGLSRTTCMSDVFEREIVKNGAILE